MSDNSNEPTVRMHAGELTCHASVEDFGSRVVVYMFFGKTPRAQLAIEFDTDGFQDKDERMDYIKREIKARFLGLRPEISIQS